MKNKWCCPSWTEDHNWQPWVIFKWVSSVSNLWRLFLTTAVNTYSDRVNIYSTSYSILFPFGIIKVFWIKTELNWRFFIYSADPLSFNSHTDRNLSLTLSKHFYTEILNHWGRNDFISDYVYCQELCRSRQRWFSTWGFSLRRYQKPRLFDNICT